MTINLDFKKLGWTLLYTSLAAIGLALGLAVGAFLVAFTGMVFMAMTGINTNPPFFDALMFGLPIFGALLVPGYFIQKAVAND